MNDMYCISFLKSVKVIWMRPLFKKELTRVVDAVDFDADTEKFLSNPSAPFDCGSVQVRLSLVILSQQFLPETLLGR